MPKLESAVLERLRTQHVRNDAARARTSHSAPVAERFSLSDYIAKVKQIPCGMYALIRTDGTLDFLEVIEANGRNWINRLYGAPGDFRREKLSYQHMWHAARHILSDLPECAQRFGRHFRTCGKCGSPLTQQVSRDLGLGPVCRKAFGL